MKKFQMILMILKEKKFWASILFIIGSVGMIFGNDFMPSNLQAELTSKIVYVLAGISSSVSLFLAMWAEIPFKKKDESNKGGKK